MLRTIRALAPVLACVSLGGSIVFADCPTRTDIHYADFGSTDGLKLNGDARHRGTELRLAGHRAWTRGSAFLEQPVLLDERTSFSTFARFRMRKHRRFGSGGLAFVIQAGGADALGVGGGALGFGQLVPSVAVELDVRRDVYDPDGNHVGINRNGSRTSLVTARPGFKLDDGKAHGLWIDYDGPNETLEVRLGANPAVRPESPTLVFTGMALDQEIGETVFLGFTGAVNWGRTGHYLAEWGTSIERPCPAGCSSDADCDDGVFCNGMEVCDAGSCLTGPARCGDGESCVEETDTCEPVRWFDEAWRRRRAIRLDNREQGVLEDFPVMVRLGSCAIDPALLGEGARALRFTDSDGVTLLAHEIERHETSGETIAWVKVPRIDANTDRDAIWLYYDNPDAADGQRAADVWTNGYAAVWHLTGTADATGNPNDGTVHGAVQGEGLLGGGFAFDGDDWIDVGADESLNRSGALTVEAWVRTDQTSGYAGLLSKKSRWWDWTGWDVDIAPGRQTIALRATGFDAGRAVGVELGGGWRYVATTLHDRTAAIYLDGVDRTTDPVSARVRPNHAAAQLGRRTRDDGYLIGQLDEVRLSDVARSADWIAAQYLSMTDAYVTCEAEEARCETVDDDCDGVDDDCDGLIDDDFDQLPTSCGLGACASVGFSTCLDGVVVDTCLPGMPSSDDNCDGVDDDCNGTADDGFVPSATTCGVGVCAGATGVLTCNAGSTSDSCDPFAGASAEVCDGLDNDCDGTVDQDDTCVPAPRLETGAVTAGGTPVTVPLRLRYVDPVVVASVVLEDTSQPVVTRVSSIAPDSFQVRLQNPSDGTVAPQPVHYLVVERGSWTIEGRRVEADTYTSTLTDGASNWTGEVQANLAGFSRPVVLGQVMSDADPRWSVFWSRGVGSGVAPDRSAFRAGKHVGEDVLVDRLDETVGYVVLESGHGTIAGVELEAWVGPRSIPGLTGPEPNLYAFSESFAAAPRRAIVSAAGQSDDDGAWAVTLGPTPASPIALSVAVDEDRIGDPERDHGTERVAYAVFAADVTYEPTRCVLDAECDDGLFCNGAETCVDNACTPSAAPCAGEVCVEPTDTCDPAPQPRLEVIRTDIGEMPTDIALANTYDRPVVTCSARYRNNGVPQVVRAVFVDSSTLRLRLQSPSGNSLLDERVSCLVVEEGVWTVDDLQLEARRFDSTVTAEDAAYIGQPLASRRTFTDPVVLGQVMSENDSRWSHFWASGVALDEVPDPTNLVVGKSVGEDPTIDRADEVLGVIVLEAGHGTVAGVEFEARVSEDVVGGVGSNPPYPVLFDRAFVTTPRVVIVTMTGVDGTNGAWAQLHGPGSVGPGLMLLSIDEDTLEDAERAHTTEQVAYLVFERAFALTP